MKPELAVPESIRMPDAAAEAAVQRAREILAADPRNPWCAYAVAKALALAGRFAGLGEAAARRVYLQACGSAPARTVEWGWRLFVASDWWARRDEL